MWPWCTCFLDFLRLAAGLWHFLAHENGVEEKFEPVYFFSRTLASELIPSPNAAIWKPVLSCIHSTAKLASDPSLGLQFRKSSRDAPPQLLPRKPGSQRKERFFGPALAKKSFVPWPMSSPRMLQSIFNYSHPISFKAHLVNFKENVLAVSSPHMPAGNQNS